MARRTVLLGVLTLVAVLTPAAGTLAQACAPPADTFTLWTAGSLRGANAWQGTYQGTIGNTFTQADLDELAARGANLVLISHAGLFTERAPYRVDEAAQSNLDRMVDMAGTAGLYAVIAFRSGPGRNEGAFRYDDAVRPYEDIWHSTAAQDGWVAMLRYTAERYRGNPAVAGYDPMVEPNAIAHHGYPSPEEFYAQYAGTLEDWNQLAARITTAVREVDTSTPIVLEGEGWGSVQWLPYVRPTGDTRTVYAVHQYEPFSFTHQGERDGITYPGRMDTDDDGIPDEQVDRAWLESLYGAARSFETSTGAPVAVTEFGAQRWAPGAAQFMADQIDVIEAFGGSWAIWEWPPASQDYDAWDILRGPDPNNHVDTPNALGDAVTSRWARGCVRPGGGTPVAPGPLFDSASACGGVVSAPAFGGATTHEVHASHPDGARTVTLTAGGLPSWASFSGTAGNPASGAIVADPGFLDFVLGLFMPDPALAVTASADTTPVSTSRCSITLTATLLR